MNKRFEDTRLNVYVNLDCTLPALLRLKVGQNLILVRFVDNPEAPFLERLRLPAPCFVTADVKHGLQIPGQPAGTYVVGLGLVNNAGKGAIEISFRSQDACVKNPVNMRLPFEVV